MHDTKIIKLNEELRNELAKRIKYTIRILNKSKDELDKKSMGQFLYLYTIIDQAITDATSERNKRLSKYKEGEYEKGNDLDLECDLYEAGFMKDVFRAISNQPVVLLQQTESMIKKYPDYFKVKLSDEWQLGIEKTIQNLPPSKRYSE